MIPRALLLFATVAACGDAVSTRSIEQSVRVTNGSFETSDYSGWTLLESSGSATAGTMTIVTTGQQIDPGSVMFDFSDQTNVDQESMGLPLIYTASEGVRLAAFLQNAAESQRMYQLVTLPTCGSFLRWDMDYTSHASFDDAAQFIAVNVRDNANDDILATPVKTNAAGSPLSTGGMTEFTADLTAFDGQTIRLDFQVVATTNMNVAFDNIRVECDNPPIASPSPGNHDFGDVGIGTAAPDQPISITNTGATELVISAVDATPPFGVSTPALPIVVMPGEMTTITATYTATAGGDQLGTISIVSNDQDSPTLIQLAGRGTGPAVSFDSPSVDFGPLRVGSTSVTRFVNITNVGSSDLVISSATTTAPFAVVTPLAATLPPFNSAQIEITFSPTAPGLVQGNLEIASDAFGSPTLLPLTGIGTVAVLDVTPPMLVFGNVRAELQSEFQSIQLTNNGGAPVTITGITSPAGIAVDGPAFPVSLLPGTTLVYDVAFAPLTVGLITNTLSIATSQGTTQIPIMGNAVRSALVADPPVIDLGEVLEHEVSNAVTVTLTNISSAPVAIFGVEGASSDVIIDPPPPTTPIPPGGSVEFGVRYRAGVAATVINGVDVLLQGAATADLSIPVEALVNAPESGCCSANTRASSIWLALATLLMLRRRRRVS